jgi:hypothetical protein
MTEKKQFSNTKSIVKVETGKISKTVTTMFATDISAGEQRKKWSLSGAVQKHHFYLKDVVLSTLALLSTPFLARISL